MISLTLACILGGCLDIPIDTRDPHEIIRDEWNRQTTRRESSSSCYIRGEFYQQCPKDDIPEDYDW